MWLAFAPVKRAQTDWLVEKATELGAARLIPVMTQRTVAERVKLERLESIAIEAAEQCGRTRLPEIAEPVKLQATSRGARRRRARSISPTKAAASRPPSAFQHGPGADPDRPRRRLHRRGARAVRARRSRRDLARPAHPARRNRGARRACRLHGRRRRLALIACGSCAARRRAPHDARARTTGDAARSSRAATICSSVFERRREAARAMAHRHRAREVRLSHRRPSRAVATTSRAASATC